MNNFLHWLWSKTFGAIGEWARKHPIKTAMILMGCIILLFVFRAVLIHPVAIYIRSHFPLFLVILGFLLYCIYYISHVSSFTWKKRIIAGILAFTLGAGLYYAGEEVYNYALLYNRYRSLNLRELSEMPLTAHERINPRYALRIFARQSLSSTEEVTDPDFVRIGNDYFWTMGIEPAYTIQQLSGKIKELFVIPASSYATTFDKSDRKPGEFEIGEDLWLSFNTETAVIKTLGISRFISYEPADIKFATDDKGEMIQIVSLIRWNGWFLPMPEFGGVQIIRQRKVGFLTLAWLNLALFGEGKWIPPEEIRNYKYLHGQNLLPREISRFIANSFRFEEGFFGPLPGRHKGDIRIPDLADDRNNQPFTVYFDCTGLACESKLYQYLALQPWGEGLEGLNTGVLVPSDGENVVYALRHYKEKEGLIGVTAVPLLIKGKNKEMYWSNNRPVEHRPFVRIIDGERRFFWLTTVVTFENASEKEDTNAGSVPDLVLTDAKYRYPVWVDAKNPAGWEEQLKQELGPIWHKNSS